MASYVPRLVVDWLRDDPDSVHRAVDGTLAFVDISGFTALTEKLAKRGKAGSEEISDVLNLVFERLLAAAYDYGAGLVKWGGDAVLLLFDEDGHAERACRAVAEMQHTIGTVGRLKTSAGAVTLRMSVGLHTGTFDFFLVGDLHRELVITGRAASTAAAMEKLAEAGEVVISSATADAVASSFPAARGAQRGDGWLLARAPDVERRPNRSTKSLAGLDLGRAMCSTLREHLTAGGSADEHRHITVAFIEFSAVDDLLDARGPAAVAEPLDALIRTVQHAAERHEVTFLATDVNVDGGKIILVSGAPKRAGDDEARVLSTVNEVLDSHQTLSLRAGATNGRVFAGDFGPFYRKTYSIAGDCVNLAARLMGKANPGEFLVVGDVLTRSRTAFEVSELAPFSVKGKVAPITAFKVGKPLGELIPAASNNLPLIGRDRELATLVGALDDAAAGHGRVVEIIGDAGMGKSRLVDELFASTDADILWARGDVYARSTPYQPLQRLLREQLGIDAGSPPGALEKALERLIAGIAPRLLAWLPLVGAVAGVDLPSTPETEALDDSFRRERLEAATSEVLGLLLTASPTVFFFDDAHFMDDASLGLLRRLCQDVGDRPWLMIVTRRPGSDSPVPDGDSVLRMPLAPLSTEAAQELVTIATEDAPLTAHRSAALAERAAGNPLFLRELVMGAAATEDLDALPDSVEGVIAARIDRLAPDKRTLLRVAAVLGMRVELDHLRQLLAPENISITVFDVNALGEFVTRDAGRMLIFKHNLVREVAYEGLPFRRRALFHGRAGDLLEGSVDRPEEIADILSVHYLNAERYSAAWRYARIAGARAGASYAPADASQFYERAIVAAAHLPDLDPDTVAEVHESLADARYVLGEMARAADALAAARQAASDPVRIARLRLKTARVRERSSDLTQALRWISRGLKSVEGRTDDAAARVRAQLTARYARVRIAQGRYVDSIRWSQRAIAEAEACGDLPALARALEFLDIAQVAMGEIAGVAPAARALEIYVELGDSLGEGHANNDLGIRAYYQGRWLDALAHYEAARTALERAGDSWDAATTSANIAELLLYWDRAEEAEPLLQRAMHIWRAAAAQPELAVGHEMLGQVAMRRGDYDRAFELLELSLDYVMAHGGNGAHRLEGLIAEAHVRAGEPERALERVSETLRQAIGAEGSAAFIPMLNRVHGFALRDLGRHEEAREAFELSVAVARGLGAEHEIAFGLMALLELDMNAVMHEEWKRELHALAPQLGLTALTDLAPTRVDAVPEQRRP